MTKKYGIKNKSSKQCRERWVNSLCPNINKGIWSESEENILFLTQLKIGNKWSELAKLLPGRSENDIKNHFYSKLRKYIRKICKELHKTKLLEKKGINSSYYSSNKVYSLIQNENIPLVNLSKNTIINVIQKDYLGKQERLLKLQENNFDYKYDNSTEGNSSLINDSLRNNELFKKHFINSQNSSFYPIEYCKVDEYEIIHDQNDFNLQNKSFLNKKKNGINIFEELLNDD